jgi:hypothetical protein
LTSLRVELALAIVRVRSLVRDQRLRASRAFAFALIRARWEAESFPALYIWVARAFAFAARAFVSTG